MLMLTPRPLRMTNLKFKQFVDLTAGEAQKCADLIADDFRRNTTVAPDFGRDRYRTPEALRDLVNSGEGRLYGIYNRTTLVGVARVGAFWYGDWKPYVSRLGFILRALRHKVAPAKAVRSVGLFDFALSEDVPEELHRRVIIALMLYLRDTGFPAMRRMYVSTPLQDKRLMKLLDTSPMAAYCGNGIQKVGDTRLMCHLYELLLPR